ncbi:MAG: hypothetical protein ABF334_07280 [Akkermansiaceae bacterium]
MGRHGAFSGCRNCDHTTVIILKLIDANHRDSQRSTTGIGDAVHRYFTVGGYRTLKGTNRVTAPDDVPADIVAAFDEGATCMAVNCFHGGGTMLGFFLQDHAQNEEKHYREGCHGRSARQEQDARGLPQRLMPSPKKHF